MSDKSPLELGNAIMAVQEAIHTAPAGWPLSAALAEFGYIMESWAQHPKGRNWDVILRLEKFIDSVSERNQSNDKKP